MAEVVEGEKAVIPAQKEEKSDLPAEENMEEAVAVEEAEVTEDVEKAEEQEISNDAGESGEEDTGKKEFDKKEELDAIMKWVKGRLFLPNLTLDHYQQQHALYFHPCLFHLKGHQHILSLYQK